MADWVLTIGDMDSDPPTAFHWAITEDLAATIRATLGDPHRETTGTGDGIVVL